MSRVLVTGGAGFIGSHVVENLLASGHEVLVVDDLSTGRRSNIPDNVEFVQLDVADSDLVSLAKSFKPDVISHLAAQASVAVSMKDPIEDARVNILGGLNVYRAAIEAECDQVVYVNTGGALYGEPEYQPCDEEHPIKPISGYALSKWTSESYFRMMLPESVPLKVLRLANVYGPRQNPHGEAGVVAIFSRLMLRGETVRIFGDGEQTRDFVYAGDVAHAHDAVMRHDQSIVVNVGTGIGTSVNQLFRHLQPLAGSSAEPIYEDTRLGDIRHVVLDSSKAQRVLGWEPKVGLADGLRETIEHVKATDA